MSEPQPTAQAAELLPAPPTTQRPRSIAVVAIAAILAAILLWVGFRSPTQDQQSASTGAAPPAPSSVPSTLAAPPADYAPLYPASEQAEQLRVEREAALAASLGIGTEPDPLENGSDAYAAAPPNGWNDRPAPWNQQPQRRDEPAPPLPVELSSEQRAQRAPLVLRTAPTPTSSAASSPRDDFKSRPPANDATPPSSNTDTFDPASFALEALDRYNQSANPVAPPITPPHLVPPKARTVSPETAPRQARLRAGSVISATLLTPINTTLQQTIKAQVTRDLWDERLRRVLVPRGSFLIGLTSTEVSSTQKRALSAWHALQLPNGQTLSLSADPGADALGTVGIPAKLNRHFWSSLGNASLLAILSAGGQLAQPRRDVNAAISGPTTNQTLAASLGTQLAQFGAEILRRDLSRAPLLTVPAPLPFTILVTADTTFDFDAP